MNQDVIARSIITAVDILLRHNRDGYTSAVIQPLGDTVISNLVQQHYEAKGYHVEIAFDQHDRGYHIDLWKLEGGLEVDPIEKVVAPEEEPLKVMAVGGRG